MHQHAVKALETLLGLAQSLSPKLRQSEFTLLFQNQEEAEIISLLIPWFGYELVSIAPIPHGYEERLVYLGTFVKI